MATYGEQFKSAMVCETKEQADAWLKKEVASYKARFNVSKGEALKTIRANLGYMAGYYDKKTSEKIHRLFGAEHPVFGKPDFWERVTPEEAFRRGRELVKGGSNV